jgi:hypothetical protein
LEKKMSRMDEKIKSSEELSRKRELGTSCLLFNQITPNDHNNVGM